MQSDASMVGAGCTGRGSRARKDRQARPGGSSLEEEAFLYFYSPF